MNLYVCAVYDKKVNAFMIPQFFRTKGEATRAFLDAVAGQDHFKKHAEDFVFMYLAVFDDSTGYFTVAPNGAEPLMTALDAMVVEGKVN